MSESRKTTAAAFFDVDGTLVPRPTLERRFLFELYRQRQFPLRNALCWLGEAGRRLPYGIEPACWSNKQYLRDTSLAAAQRVLERVGKRVNYFSEAIERVCWHAVRGHAIVIVSGTLEELALLVAQSISEQTTSAGSQILICATPLEEQGNRWTGRLRGPAMRGRGKALAAKRLAETHGWKLADCWAYGDSASDRWILDAVGHGVAVNPGLRLSRLARERGWLEMRWNSSSPAWQASNRRAGRCGAEPNQAAGQTT
jgi:HAD superfamily hydrolase (TIGR01490 family)